MSRLKVTLHAEFVLSDIWGDAEDFVDDGEVMVDMLAELLAEDIFAMLEEVLPEGSPPADMPNMIRALIQKVEVVP